jgi:hypothetical protein
MTPIFCLNKNSRAPIHLRKNNQRRGGQRESNSGRQKTQDGHLAFGFFLENVDHRFSLVGGGVSADSYVGDLVESKRGKGRRGRGKS